MCCAAYRVGYCAAADHIFRNYADRVFSRAVGRKAVLRRRNSSGLPHFAVFLYCYIVACCQNIIRPVHRHCLSVRNIGSGVADQARRFRCGNCNIRRRRIACLAARFCCISRNRAGVGNRKRTRVPLPSARIDPVIDRRAGHRRNLDRGALRIHGRIDGWALDLWNRNTGTDDAAGVVPGDALCFQITRFVHGHRGSGDPVSVVDAVIHRS